MLIRGGTSSNGRLRRILEGARNDRLSDECGRRTSERWRGIYPDDDCFSIMSICPQVRPHALEVERVARPEIVDLNMVQHQLKAPADDVDELLAVVTVRPLARSAGR